MGQPCVHARAHRSTQVPVADALGLARVDEPPELRLDEALRDLVHTHISGKHLSTAYASASETARTGSGDCTEHAVLLAAVLGALQPAVAAAR